MYKNIRSNGVIHQLYEVTNGDDSRRVAGQLAASRLRVGPNGYTGEHTTFGEDERAAAIAWWSAGAPEPEIGTEGHPTLYWKSGDGRFSITGWQS